MVSAEPVETVDCVVCFGNSNTVAVNDLGDSLLSDWQRYLWLGANKPVGTAPYDDSDTTGGAKWWMIQMPSTPGDERTVESVTASSVTVDGAALAATDMGRAVFVRSSTGHGQYRQIVSGTGTNVIGVSPNWTTNPEQSTIEIVGGSHSVASVSGSTITKASTTAAFPASAVGKTLFVLTDGLAGSAYRVTARTDHTITVDGDVSGLSANDLFMVTTTGTESIDAMVGSWRDFQVVYQNAQHYSDGYDFASYDNQPATTPILHVASASLSYAPEVAWQMRGASGKPIRAICLGVSGSTMSPAGTGGSLLGISWARDLTALDWHPTSEYGLLRALKNTIAAAAAAELSDTGLTLNVVALCSTLIENQGATPGWIAKSGEDMVAIRDHLRQWLAEEGYTQREPEQVLWLAADGGAAQSVANAAVSDEIGDDPYARLISTDDLARPDNAHIDAPGQVDLGRRMWEQWDAIIEAEKAAANEPKVYGASEALWFAVKERYEVSGLLTLTNVRDPSATVVNDAVGELAAQQAIDLWGLYTQVDFDYTNPQHLAVGVRGVIAVLWERGGTSSQIAKVEWEEVFGDAGLVSKVRKTGPRGRAGPLTNSGVQNASELVNGRAVKGWSDRSALPRGILPRQQLSSGPDGD